MQKPGWLDWPGFFYADENEFECNLFVYNKIGLALHVNDRLLLLFR